jgi:hypothetical protein
MPFLITVNKINLKNVPKFSECIHSFSTYARSFKICIFQTRILWYMSPWPYGKVNFQAILFKASKFCIKMYEMCESSSSYVRSLVAYSGWGMELMNQFVTAEKKNCSNCSKAVRTSSWSWPLWMDSFYNSPVSSVHAEGTTCIGTLCAH